MLLSELRRVSAVCGGQCLTIEIPDRPPSNNHYKGHFFDKRSGKTRYFRNAAADKFLGLTKLVCMGKIFVPRETMSVIIEVHSPEWVTKASTIREMDIDNSPKVVLDAVSFALGFNDCQVWEGHQYKVHSKQRKTVVHLFGLGDVVDSLV